MPSRSSTSARCPRSWRITRRCRSALRERSRNGAFSLIGRLQLQYSDGFWNEWYVLFQDGSNGWLSDASGQYTMTFVQHPDSQLPAFEKLAPGRTLSAAGRVFVASDVRTAQCTAGQGELPFQVGQGYVARVADFRCDDRFLTLDYSDKEGIRVYQGQSVQLPDLKPQLLRDPATITDSAGRFRGKVSALTCPACGAAVKTVPGVTVHVLCPNCHATVDTAGPVATVLAAGQVVERAHFSLQLGAEANIAGVRYSLLGALRRSDGEYSWSEYLLYAPGKKFTWLIETDDGWQTAEVLDRWPSWDAAGHVMHEQRVYNKSSDYKARVVFAAGSFNWRVKVGDVVHVAEYSSGPMRLAAELSSEEMTWSRSSPAALDQVRAWFGTQVQGAEHPAPAYKTTARRILFSLLIINLIPLLLAPGNVIGYLILTSLAIYLPAYFLDASDSRKP